MSYRPRLTWLISLAPIRLMVIRGTGLQTIATALTPFLAKYLTLKKAHLQRSVRGYTLRVAKSKQFLLQGKLGAGFHTAGQPILDAALANATINVDDLLISSSLYMTSMKFCLTLPEK